MLILVAKRTQLIHIPKPIAILDRTCEWMSASGEPNTRVHQIVEWQHTPRHFISYVQPMMCTHDPTAPIKEPIWLCKPICWFVDHSRYKCMWVRYGYSGQHSGLLLYFDTTLLLASPAQCRFGVESEGGVCVSDSWSVDMESQYKISTTHHNAMGQWPSYPPALFVSVYKPTTIPYVPSEELLVHFA